MSIPQIQQAVHFHYVTDLTSETRFWSKIIRLPIALDQGTCKIFRLAGDSFLGLCSCREGSVKGPQSNIITLVSDEVDAWAEYLIECGLVLDKPPVYNQRFNIYHLFISSPTGLRVEIQSFMDPRWPKSQVPL